MGRAALVGVPTWIVLLALLPFTGLGVGACLALATVLAIAAIVVAERLRRREERGEGVGRGVEGAHVGLAQLAGLVVGRHHAERITKIT